MALGRVCILRGHPVHRVDKRGEVSPAFEACRLILFLLLLRVSLKDFGGGGGAVGSGVRVANADVEDSSAAAAPEAVGQYVAPGLIAGGGGLAGRIHGTGGSIGRGGSHAVAIEDGWFGHNAQVSESNAAEVGQFIACIVVTNSNQAPFFCS